MFDADFFKKISPQIGGKIYLIPQPKLPAPARDQRRLSYRNERILYKRKSSLSGDQIVSFFDSDSPFIVYSHDEWWSDNWDPLKYGQDYDFSRGFFDQFYELQLKVPRPPLVNNKAENSPYCNFADDNKNCHLCTSSNHNQDCYYNFPLVSCKDCVDCLWCSNSEILYECIDCQDCYDLKFSQNCSNCSDGNFLLNCRGVRNCIMCCNLSNKEYHVLNNPVSKEEFLKYKGYLRGSHRVVEELKDIFEKFKKEHPIRRANTFTFSENVSGDFIYNSKNIEQGFDVYDSEDCAYLHDGLKAKDCADICFFDGVELCYESTSLIGYKYRFTNFCRDSYDLLYCDNCHACKNCFGCVGLRNKKYCILNKQYSENDYNELLPRIIMHMETMHEWGEFFPTKYSLFAYNETLANDYYPLSKKEVLANGWKWKDPAEKEIFKSNYQVPDYIGDVDEKICDKILTCEKSGENFKIIPQELNFYKKHDLPIPRLSPNQRNRDRLGIRNPRILNDMSCDKCGKKVHTTYGVSGYERIYCEQCYSDEIV